MTLLALLISYSLGSSTDIAEALLPFNFFKYFPSVQGWSFLKNASTSSLLPSKLIELLLDDLLQSYSFIMSIF